MEENMEENMAKQTEGFFVVLDGNWFAVVHGERGTDMPLDVDGQWVFDINEGDAAQTRADALNQTVTPAAERRAQLKQMTGAGREDEVLNDVCVCLVKKLGDAVVRVNNHGDAAGK
jgi:hypothetical protein